MTIDFVISPIKDQLKTCNRADSAGNYFPAFGTFDPAVALSVDSSRALRTPQQLAVLIRAVAAASAEDESRSVEWKSAYDDVTSSDAAFALGRAVLGLANRPTPVAARDFEGVGYVLVGVEPGRLSGQLIPDSAKLVDAIDRYAGHTAVHWDPRIVSVDGVDVLVITVEPPREGDRIALLRKGFQPKTGPFVPAGTIFVRRPGKTDRATLADVEMLQDRLLAGLGGADASAQVEIHRDLRQLTADLVGAAHDWHSSIQLLLIMSASSDFTKNSMVDLSKTEMLKDTVAAAKVMRDASRRILLLASDPVLRSAVTTADALFAGVAEYTQIPLTGRGDDSSRADAYAAINRLLRAYDDVQVAAMGFLDR